MRSELLTSQAISIDSTSVFSSFSSNSTFVLKTHRRHLPGLAVQLLHCIVAIAAETLVTFPFQLYPMPCHFPWWYLTGQNSILPMTRTECFEVKPMTPFECYNLEPMTPCGCCNLKPMTLFRVVYITKIISFFPFSPKWKSFSNFQLNSCDQYKNTFLSCMIYVYVTGSL